MDFQNPASALKLISRPVAGGPSSRRSGWRFCLSARGPVWVKPVGAPSVQGVAKDWRAQSVGVGAVYPQLVRAARQRVQCQAHVSAPLARHSPVCHSLTPTLAVDNLARTVHRVGSYREAYAPLAGLEAGRVEQCHVAFPYAAALKLRLEQAAGFLALCHHEQPRGVHVEAVHHQRFGLAAPLCAQHALHRPPLRPPRHGEQAGRLVHHGHEAVFVYRFQQSVVILSQRVGINVEPLQHVFQYRQALAPAGRVVVEVAAKLGLGRLAPPEFGHAEGLEAVLVGALQQFRGATFACSRGRRAARLGAEYVVEVAPPPHGVEHAELREYPCLQFVRPPPPLGPQPVGLAPGLVGGAPGFGFHLGVAFLHAPQLGFHVLALAHQGGLVGPIGAESVAAELRLGHSGLVARLLFLANTAHLGKPPLRLGLHACGLKLCQPCVDGRYFALFFLEIPAGLQYVEHRRDEERPVVASAELPRIGGQVSHSAARHGHH